MAPIEYIIDPEPDTIIILKNPCSVFAPWDQADEDRDSQIPVSPPPIKMSKKEMKIARKRATRDSNINDPVEASQATGIPDTSADPLEESSQATVEAEASSAGQDEAVCDGRTSPPNGPPVPAEPEQVFFRYHVSSRHLMLASPVFKRALSQDGFAESVRNESDGLYHIEAHDWDPEAFLVVLRIVHNRNKLVPREVTLEMLAKIAVLEDYYTLGEALDMFTEVWIEKLSKAPLPSVYCKELVLWIWIAWVFDIEKQFKEATFTAIMQSTESLRTLDLPIPTIVSDEIDSRRYQAMESVMEGLHQRLEKYRRIDYACPYDSSVSFQCGSFLLGGMQKEMNRLGLYQPRPEVPFPDVSFGTLCAQVKLMENTCWSSEGSYYSRSYDEHSCNLKDAMNTLIADALSGVSGLDLKFIKNR